MTAEICLKFIVEGSVPIGGNFIHAQAGACDASHRRSVAVVIQTDGYGRGNIFRKISFSQRQSEYHRAHIVDGVHAVHIGKSLVDLFSRVEVVLYLFAFFESPIELSFQLAVGKQIRRRDRRLQRLRRRK